MTQITFKNVYSLAVTTTSFDEAFEAYQLISILQMLAGCADESLDKYAKAPAIVSRHLQWFNEAADRLVANFDVRVME